MADIPVEKLHELFEYRDGELFWKRESSKALGSLSGRGYLSVTWKGISCRVHRVIFAMHHGFYPKQVDHIDGNKLNNKIENLRASNNSQNSFNKGLSSRNTSGYKNVHWDKVNRKWRVSFRVNGKVVVEKRFFKIEEAVDFARETREKLHGEFARHE